METIKQDFICPFLLFSGRHHFTLTKTLPRFWYTSSIFLIEKGKGKLEVENQTYELYPGCLIYLPPWRSHTFFCEKNSLISMRYCYFDWKYTDRPNLSTRRDFVFWDPIDDSPLYRNYIGPTPQVDICEYKVVENLQLWLNLLDPLSNGFDAMDDYDLTDSLKIQSHFQAFLHHFLKNSIHKNQYVDPRIQKVIDRMEKCISENELSGVGEWAEQLGLTRTYFQTLFKKETGFTPKFYWIRHRMFKVMDDLKNTSTPISDIALKYKYSSLHYFSKQFHKITGETPSNYRKRNQIF